MKRTMMFFTAICIMFAPVAFADEEDSGGFGFQAGISLGTDVLVVDDLGTTETWNSLGFQPDLSLGNFGIGFDMTVHFKLMPDTNTTVEIYPGDWVPDYEGSGKNVLDLYLPKVMYLRYGFRGDPLYAKLGSIEDLTLGNGFIVGEYANTRFLPGQRVFGLDVGLDGALFGFPYVGIELLTGNLARFDVFGGRLFVRPLISTGLPILENLQVGGTIAMDRGVAGLASDETFDPLAVYGADIFLPLLTGKAFPLAVFTEVAFEPNDSAGAMIGAGGRLVSVITYGAQLRFLGAGFTPVYFDANYDLFRKEKSELMDAPVTGDGFVGWLATAGASLFGDALFFKVSVDGPFKETPAVAATNPNSADYPHLRGVIGMADDLLGGFFVSGSYDKYFIGKDGGFFDDLVDPNDAVISAAFNYKTGAAVFTLLYNLNYNSLTGGYDVTSSLQSSIKF